MYKVITHLRAAVDAYLAELSDIYSSMMFMLFLELLPMTTSRKKMLFEKKISQVIPHDTSDDATSMVSNLVRFASRDGSTSQISKKHCENQDSIRKTKKKLEFSDFLKGKKIDRLFLWSQIFREYFFCFQKS